ncbi:DUF4097 and DUF4098 domain-containing protein YvlB [Salirhabdus euzebyi]|uniref:DUF4097 and DUF4098 domain-containing protein YvlB n=1 Tax=Salirhabdus euzebyi TaxID=394506 RepID=A0A841QAV3_9BACI|nr:DUF4097 family beta strand repeat-containing protein [Salirhabdus euzebyi]MBB6455332.1 DUF4097 and DUF4098 domain-containing protein YvlB [Salirhabdus euzebyi]
MKIIGVCLITILTILISGIGFIFYTEGADAFSFNTVKIQENQQIQGDDIQNIYISSGSTDVELVKHSGNEIDIELDGEVSEKMKDAFDLKVSETNRTLEVELDRLMRPSFTVFAINKGTKLTIKIPSNMYQDIIVESSSGDIYVNGITSDKVDLQAKSGDITIKNSFAQTAFLKANSGDITGSDLLTVDAKTTSGDISLSTKENSFTLQFKSNSGEGEINVPGFLFEKKEEDLIVGKLGDGEYSMSIRTNSGDFLLN